MIPVFLCNCVLYSLCSDGETYLSADDLRINLWNLEISDQCFNIIDMKPGDMEDLTGEVFPQQSETSHHKNLPKVLETNTTAQLLPLLMVPR